ncbi:MAG: DUF3810 domain-containing protein [Planctomycetes bacterium]|nr:DUF3810 domain-containing protein [Planctomycetota bacterium]
MANAPDETAALKTGKDQPLPIGVFALFTPDEAMPKDRGLHVKRRGGLTLAAFVLIGLCWALGQSPGFVEDVYAAGLSQWAGRGLAAVSGVSPTSLAEVAIVFLAAWALLSTGAAALHVLRRKRRFFNALACGTLRVLCVAAVAVALFYLLWGVNYFRQPLIERQGWQKYAAEPASREDQTRELAALCRAVVDSTNVAYVQAMGSDDMQVPSVPLAELAVLDASIDEGYESMRREMGLPEAFGVSRGRAKPVALSAVMPYLNIGGFYFPWTGEANFNRSAPWCTVPHTIAHEKAHQRCITSEDECNFFGAIACLHSPDSYVRYSGLLFVQRQLLGELYALDRDKATELVKRRHKGVQRDVDDVRAWWAKYSEGLAGTVGQVSTAVNDTYLKVNRVEQGVRSYGLSAQLLVAYARRQGGLK